MALFIAPIVSKQSGTHITTYSPALSVLLNTKKVEDFEKYSANSAQTLFWYSMTDDSQYRSRRCITTLTRQQFKAKVRETDNERFIQINFIEFNGKTGIDVVKEINVDRLVWGYDTTVNGKTGYSYIWIERGAFKPYIKGLTTHTIAEINHSSSGSVSLSAS